MSINLLTLSFNDKVPRMVKEIIKYFYENETASEGAFTLPVLDAPNSKHLQGSSIFSCI